jgi:hypothetical protein
MWPPASGVHQPIATGTTRDRCIPPVIGRNNRHQHTAQIAASNRAFIDRISDFAILDPKPGGTTNNRLRVR